LILTVTPNPAWDLTYQVPALVPGEVHRVASVHRKLGGKGVNVARVLHVTGHDAVAVIPGPPGLTADADQDVPAVPSAAVGSRLVFDVVPGLPVIRQTLVVQDADGTTTSLWEPGIEPDPGAERALADRVRAWLHPDGLTGKAAHAQGAGAGSRAATGARGIVVSGSLPPGFDAHFHARLATMALETGVPAVIDTSGEALRHAASVPGAVLTPNAAELAQLTGQACHGPAEAIDAARTLLDGPPLAVVVTLGENGLAVITRNGIWRGRLTEPLSGNPTGAGDAAAAALITGLAAAASWPEIVREAVALSAGAVLSPVAGEVAPADIARLRSQVIVTEVA
jgi:fructose-1-phosphate kinase PfkB-like protein